MASLFLIVVVDFDSSPFDTNSYFSLIRDKYCVFRDLKLSTSFFTKAVKALFKDFLPKSECLGIEYLLYNWLSESSIDFGLQGILFNYYVSIVTL